MPFAFSRSQSLIPPSPRLPGGLQGRVTIENRQRVIASVMVILTGASLFILGLILAAGGWTWGDSVILVCALVVLPSLLLDAINAVIGFFHLRRGAAGFQNIAPHALSDDVSLAIRSKTAILLTLRNDPVDEAIRRFKLIHSSVESTGEAGHFAFFILSDTSDPVLAKREEALVTEWNAGLPDFAPVHYRRRLVNAGYKAGNLADFCRNWGDRFDFVIPLDVTSFMTGPAMVDLVRIMQAHPKIGIVQSLAVPTPTRSAFARLTAFSERCRARVCALGEAWWQADCAMYEGRNAILRIAPFYIHCRMPHLEGRSTFSGAVIKHEIIEAAMMHRAGYEVRSLPVEMGSYSDVSSSLVECVNSYAAHEQGQLQLLRFIGLERIAPVYRVMLFMRALDAVAPLFLLVAILFASFKVFENYDIGMLVSETVVKIAYMALLIILILPRLAGYCDALFTPDRVRAFGGQLRFSTSAGLALFAAYLIQPVLVFRAAFALLRTPFARFDQGTLMAEKRVSITPLSIFKSFWPISLFGTDLLLFLLLGSPDFAFWSMPLTFGFAFAVPIAWLISSQTLYRGIDRAGLFGVPEIFNPPREIALLAAREADRKLDRAA